MNHKLWSMMQSSDSSVVNGPLSAAVHRFHDEIFNKNFSSIKFVSWYPGYLLSISSVNSFSFITTLGTWLLNSPILFSTMNITPLWSPCQEFQCLVAKVSILSWSEFEPLLSQCYTYFCLFFLSIWRKLLFNFHQVYLHWSIQTWLLTGGILSWPDCFFHQWRNWW